MKKITLLWILLQALSSTALPALETVVDDFGPDCRLTGVWADNRSNNYSAAGTWQNGYHYTSSHPPFKRTGKETAVWTPNLPRDGAWRVEVSCRAGANRSSRVTYEVRFLGGAKTFVIDQRDGEGMKWFSLGTFSFDRGRSGSVAIVSDGGQSASADAARFTWVGEEGGTLDGVLGNPAQPTPGSGPAEGIRRTLRVDKTDRGPKTFTFTEDTTVRLTADLTSWGASWLKAVLSRVDGGNETLLFWARNDDRDASPLQFRGTPLPESIEDRGGGDFSPKATVRSFEGKKGDSITLTFGGKPGDAGPYLLLECAPENDSMNSPADEARP